jgi:RNA polymerase sigma factor (sigma-70 family)
MASPPAPRPDLPDARAAELRAWMETYSPALRRYFRRKATAAEADELVQDVFLAIHNRGAGEPIDNVQGYLFRIASNLLARRAGQGRTVGLFHDDQAPPNEFSPERLLIGKQDVEQVIVAIRKLPPRARAAFVFHRFEDMTYAAIAARMGVSLSAVRQLIGRASAAVAADLKQRP